MFYIKLENNRATQIINEVDSKFPNIPINQRYAADFLNECIVTEEAPKLGYIYDKQTNSFYAPAAPSPSFTLSEAIDFKCSEINSACENAILNGFDLDGSHYSMTANDQSNLISLTPLAQAGKTVPYHADGEECKLYTPAEFMAVVARATVHKTHHTTYCNLLKMQVKEMDSADNINAVKYDNTPLNTEYQQRYNEIMGAVVGD